jgi:hypothetical protein
MKVNRRAARPPDLSHGHMVDAYPFWIDSAHAFASFPFVIAYDPEVGLFAL